MRNQPISATPFSLWPNPFETQPNSRPETRDRTSSAGHGVPLFRTQFAKQLASVALNVENASRVGAENKGGEPMETNGTCREELDASGSVGRFPNIPKDPSHSYSGSHSHSST
ncbi:hypothetical protein KQX54_021562 [Cotesia glomerata]|uniref:Uncharacterized protein n=1 Tax=Cotesia glomerata TaxID=32391 RepID=A0AAV7JA36_COTGL|nr:hypothetical protein KQX54_021562 [Cotesia glomerata]